MKFKKKTIIITLQLSIMEANIKPLSKEVTVMTMHGDLKDIVRHGTQGGQKLHLLRCYIGERARGFCLGRAKAKEKTTRMGY